MKGYLGKYSANIISLFIAIVGLTTVVGCSVKFVADYDSKTYEEILNAGKKVDMFYGNLLEVDERNRQYQKYAGEYVEIEAELRSLYTRNKSRPLNEESTMISESILKLWIKYKDRHKMKDKYTSGNAKLDRNRFGRLFVSAASAEVAKDLDPDDKDISKDSK